MIYLLIPLVIAALGVGALLAAIVHMVRTRNALPAWTNQTDRLGRYAGRQ